MGIYLFHLHSKVQAASLTIIHSKNLSQWIGEGVIVRYCLSEGGEVCNIRQSGKGGPTNRENTKTSYVCGLLQKSLKCVAFLLFLVSKLIFWV